MKTETRQDTIELIRDELRALENSEVRLTLKPNRGKPQIITGVMVAVYPNIFTVHDNSTARNISFNYSDVACGNVMVSG